MSKNEEVITRMVDLVGKLEVDGVCQFCQGNCFTALLQGVPETIKKTYLDFGVTMLATCTGGQKLEKSAVGYSFDDIWDELL